MTKKRFRARWENYFSSFTDEQLFAIQYLVADMHKSGNWFAFVGKVTDAWVRSQRKDEEPTVEESTVKPLDEEVIQEQHAVH
jgi:hypothetical protein|tara:strand:+ start:712 stop:957 length:246 start_codon:yes stop_codon:yes gene_type:complete